MKIEKNFLIKKSYLTKRIKRKKEKNINYNEFLALLTDCLLDENNLELIVLSEKTENILSGDVVDIKKINGEFSLLRRIHRADSFDNSLFLTNMCNSDCVFCPDYEEVRSKKSNYTKEILENIKLYPKEIGHLTITGGEPTLLKSDFFNILNACKENLNDTFFTILTNGRMFYYKKFCDLYLKNKPKNTKIAIPIHASTSKLHDTLSGVENSYVQTLTGINNLLKLKENIEIRIVLNKQNIKDLNNIANLIVKNFRKVIEVNIMSLELSGNASKDYKKFWMSKSEITPNLKKAITTLLKANINVQLYNFPLCYVEFDYWNFARKSITDYKRFYKEECNLCKQKDKCGGFFKSTVKVVNPDVYPYLK